MQTIDKDILTVTEGIICHQVNCRKKMGAGLALRVRKKWPIVYEKYMETTGFVGDTLIVNLDDKLYVANLYGQDRYGRDRCYTDYNALKICFKKVKYFSENNNNLQVYVPQNMGCNLGGGDWNIVSKIIEDEIPTVIFCNYNA